MNKSLWFLSTITVINTMACEADPIVGDWNATEAGEWYEGEIQGEPSTLPSDNITSLHLSINANLSGSIEHVGEELPDFKADLTGNKNGESYEFDFSFDDDGDPEEVEFVCTLPSKKLECLWDDDVWFSFERE